MGFEQNFNMAAEAAERPKTTMRSAWIDAARGIGIILVVLGHAERGLVKAGMPLPAADVLDATIYAFHMPLFFLLAGLHVPRGLRHGRGTFLRDKLVTIVWPYFLWSTAYIGINMMVGAVNQPLGLGDLQAVAWRPVAHFWFLYALFLCNLLAAALWPNRWLLLGATIGSAFLWIGFGTSNIVLEMAQMFAFFTIGMACGPKLPAANAGLDRFAPALMIGGFLLLALICGLAGTVHWPVEGEAALYYAGAFSGITGVTGLALLVGERLAWLRRIGQASMTIFVTHIFFSAGARITVLQTGLRVDPVVLLVLSSLLAVAAPWAIYEVAGRRRLTTILGLGKFVRV